jgi:hypothetical protein
MVLLKGRFAQQKVSVKVEHYWKLECVRRIVELEDAEPGRI